MEFGITLTPDRLMLYSMLVAFAIRWSNPRPGPTTWAATGLRRFLAAFALIGITSWSIADPDAKYPTFVELTHLTNLALLPTLFFMMASRLRYDEAMLRRMFRFYALFGMYPSLHGFLRAPSHRRARLPKVHSRSACRHPIRPQPGALRRYDRGWRHAAAVVPLRELHRVLDDGGAAADDDRWHAPRRAGRLFHRNALHLARSWGNHHHPLLSENESAEYSGDNRGIVLIAFVAGVSSKFSLFQDTPFLQTAEPIENRLDNYQMAWNAFKANPVLGLGYGKFMPGEICSTIDSPTSRLGVGLDDGNHSTLLGISADLGVIGAFPILGSWLFGTLTCIAAYRSLGGPARNFQRQFSALALGAVGNILRLEPDERSYVFSRRSTPASFWLVGVATAYILLAWPRSPASPPMAKSPRIPPCVIRAIQKGVRSFSISGSGSRELIPTFRVSIGCPLP